MITLTRCFYVSIQYFKELFFVRNFSKAKTTGQRLVIFTSAKKFKINVVKNCFSKRDANICFSFLHFQILFELFFRHFFQSLDLRRQFLVLSLEH